MMALLAIYTVVFCAVAAYIAWAMRKSGLDWKETVKGAAIIATFWPFVWAICFLNTFDPTDA